MITRLYIDNYKCFSNFEYSPGKSQLLLGRNGAGKSSAIEVIDLIKSFVLDRKDVSALFPSQSKTRWDQRETQTIELDVEDAFTTRDPRLPAASYRYRLAVHNGGTQDQPIHSVLQESLMIRHGSEQDWHPLYERELTDAKLYVEDEYFSLLVNQSLSGLSLIEEGSMRSALTRFKQRLSRLYSIQITPRLMSALSNAEERHPRRDMANYASWYRHLAQDDPVITVLLFNHLKEILDGFNGLQLKGDGTRRLVALIRSDTDESFSYDFDELSDGQRALVALYTVAGVLEMSAASERGPSVTFWVDEPENYVALSELQPWIHVVEEAVEASAGQLLIVSHHPEFINYYAHSNAVRFYREDAGPVRTAPFTGSSSDPLLPSEVVARMWEDE